MVWEEAFDTDDHGTGLRPLITNGRWVTVCPRLSCADVAFGVNAEFPRGLEVFPSLFA
jgi:hypothetical protein